MGEKTLLDERLHQAAGRRGFESCSRTVSQLAEELCKRARADAASSSILRRQRPRRRRAYQKESPFKTLLNRFVAIVARTSEWVKRLVPSKISKLRFHLHRESLIPQGLPIPVGARPHLVYAQIARNSSSFLSPPTTLGSYRLETTYIHTGSIAP